MNSPLDTRQVNGVLYLCRKERQSKEAHTYLPAKEEILMTPNPFEAFCDCQCAVHKGHTRTMYNHEGCTCVLSCATQPMTLLAKPWGCVFFLDVHGDLWFANEMVGGGLDWDGAGEIDSRGDYYDTSVLIGQQLRQLAVTFEGAPQ